MKNLLKIGAISAAALLLFRLVSGRKKAAQNLRIVPIDIAIDGPKSRNAAYSVLYFKVKFNLINDEQLPISVSGADLDIFFKGKAIGKIVKDQAFSVPGRQSTQVTFLAQISSVNIVSSILDILQNANGITLTIDGTIDTQLGRIPVQFTKKINL
jgi:LEA14-like dessication related protein